MSLPLSRCLVLPNRLLTFGYGQYSLEVDIGFPATKSSVSQIIEKLDSLPNSARDTAVNNSIVPSDNLAGLGESVRNLVYSWDPVEEALIAAGCPDAPSVDRIIEDFKSTYESSISGIEAVCQIVTSAWDEKTAAEDVHSESLDHICERASSAIDDAMDDSRAVGRSEDIDK